MTIGAASLLYLALFVLPPLLIPSVPGPAVSPAPAVSPPTFADIAKAQSDARGNLVGALGVIAFLIGGFVGVANFLASRRQNLDTLELTRRGQMADRFTQAIEQLGHSEAPDLAIRLRGIYALEQISRDSEDLHWPVMEVLTAFLRLNSQAPPDIISTDDHTGKVTGPSQDLGCCCPSRGRCNERRSARPGRQTGRVRVWSWPPGSKVRRVSACWLPPTSSSIRKACTS